MSEKGLPAECSHCGGADLYTTNTPANGGYGPTLLPGLGSLFSYAKFDVVLCTTCGHTRFFADRHARQKVAAKSSWKRVVRS